MSFRQAGRDSKPGIIENPPRGWPAAAFARSGVRAARMKSAQLKEKGYKSAYLALDIAHQYGVVEDKGKVLERLDQAFRDDDGDWNISSRTAPEFDCVRSDPRFHDLLRRRGLEH